MAGNADHDAGFTFDESGVDDPENYEDEVSVSHPDADSAGGDGNDAVDIDDPELEAIKARVREMEEEAEKLKEMQNEVEKQMNLSSSSIGSPPAMSVEEKLDADGRSIWVGNVDYGATAEELESHFHGCGSVNRVTILCDKFTGHPKGFAYIEFADRESGATAMALDQSLFRGRQIMVTLKRTNRPGISTTNRAPRSRSRRPRAAYTYGYTPSPRPYRGGRFRPRRSAYYAPY